MKKIPTLFVREYDERGNVVGVTKEVAAGMEWVLAGDGEATEKVDGSACAIINGELYKRFDAKEGRAVPEGAIPCQPTCDQYTGHWPQFQYQRRQLPGISGKPECQHHRCHQLGYVLCHITERGSGYTCVAGYGYQGYIHIRRYQRLITVHFQGERDE